MALQRRSATVAAASAAVVLAALPARAQTEFWLETFDNGCDQLCPGDGYAGVNGPWTVADVSPPGADANIWYVSCAENGGAEGSCGRGCGSDATLHVGNVATSPAAFLFCPTGDCGAAYDTTDSSVVADKRIVSPPIDATGKSSLSVELLYLGEGEPCSDSADLELSLDGGSSWTTLAACLTSDNSGCFGQGEWTRTTVDLPAGADGRPDLRIAFRWRNDGNGFGADPSFAVDDVSLRHAGSGCPDPPPPIPADLGNHLRGVKAALDADFEWTAMGPPAPTTTHFHVYRNLSPRIPVPSSWTLMGGDAPPVVAQVWSDPGVIADGATYFYDVRSADDCEGIAPR